jgi:CRP-like cAMP-binding protein
MSRKANEALTLTPSALRYNSVLAGLSSRHAAELLECGRLIQIQTPQQIYHAHGEIDEVYFPIDAVLSVITQMRNGVSIEVGTIGREGVSAIPLLLGATTSANESYCQVPGRVIVVSADHFRRLLNSGDDGFRIVLDRFLQAYVNMLRQLAACNVIHSIYERCSRRLLLTHDRVNCDQIALTHKYLAMMLGAGRSGVTIAAAALQQAGLFDAHGHIVCLTDRGSKLPRVSAMKSPAGMCQ